MNKNLAEKLSQSQLEVVNQNLTPFPVLNQHGGVVPLFLQKKLDCMMMMMNSFIEYIHIKRPLFAGKMKGW